MTGKGKTGSFSLSLSESAWEVLRMLRVVLADDENKVILLMQKLIDWEALGYEIATMDCGHWSWCGKSSRIC